ncbi:sensor histidine kinase [Myroides sp. LJL115]
MVSYFKLIVLAVCVFLLLSCNKDKQYADYTLLGPLTNNLTEKDSLYEDKVRELLSIANQIQENTQENRNLFVTILQNSSNTIDSTNFNKLINKALNYSLQKNDLHNQADLYQIQSRNFYKTQQLDSTYSNLVKAEKIFNTLNDSLKSGHLALAKAKILFENGIFSESEKENIKAIKYLNNSDDFILKYESNHMMGLNLTELLEFEEAKKYYDISAVAITEMASKKTLPQDRIDFFLSNLNNNLSHLYYHSKDYPNAKKYALKGIYENPSLDQNPQLHSTLLINLLKAKLELNEYENILPQIQEITFLEKDNRSIGLYAGGIPSALMVEANFYKKMNQTQKSLASAKQSYSISKKERRLQNTKEALAFLAANDKENQTQYINEYIQLNDTLMNLERQTKNKFARIEFEVDKISELNKRLSGNNQTILILTCLLVFGFSITMFSIIQYAKNKRLLLRNKNQLANEKIYKLMLEQKELAENAKFSERKRIAKELHDGVINRIFTARFHLMQLDCFPPEKKDVLIEELHKSEQEIRTISHILNTKVMHDADPFDELLENLISNQNNPFNTKFIFQMDEDINWHLYSNEQKLNIYRIIQESLQNINKYSQASQAIISLTGIKNKRVRVKISDDGIGYNKNDPRIKNKGLGMKNMNERIKELQTHLVIKTSKDQGVSICFDVKQKYEDSSYLD